MYIGIILSSQVLAGYFISKSDNKILAKSAAWGIVLLVLVFGCLIPARLNPVSYMMVLISVLFLSVKSLAVTFRYPLRSRLNFVQWLCFSLGWPGMDPVPFEGFKWNKNNGAGVSVLKSGLVSIAIGLIWLTIIAVCIRYTLFQKSILAFLSIPGFIFIFHSGLMNILCNLWLRKGVILEPLMDKPWLSASLSDFWGKRWNRAFIEMMRITVFFPLRRYVRGNWALLVSFLISAIFHEYAISLPVKAGYGLPGTYFILQALLVLFERKYLQATSGIFRRVWTLCCILLPSPLLFHKPFITGIILPLLSRIADCLTWF